MKKHFLPFKLGLVAALILLSAFLSLNYYNWQENYRNKFYPGLKIGSINLSGLNLDEARKIIREESDKIIDQGLSFNYKDKEVIIELNSDSFEPDLSYQLLSFNIENSLQAILTESGTNNFLKYLSFKLLPANKKVFSLSYNLDEERLQELISIAFSELNVPPANAFFDFDKNSNELKIVPEKIGKEINYELALEKLNKNLGYLLPTVVEIKTQSKYPIIRQNDLLSFEAQAKQLIDNQGIKLVYKKLGTETTSKLWTIKPDKIAYWLIVEKLGEDFSLVLDEQKISEHLKLAISPEVDIEAIRPKFEIKSGKVSAWQKGINGQKLNIEASAKQIKSAFLNQQKEIDLIIDRVESEDPSEEIKYNIQEIIGTGHSNFAGSPTNRRKNIKIGAEAINGILIAPGEEFSLVRVLGEVSAETGYFPELVIKDNKTIPEYGGGLCQVATTIFRSAIQSGLPITARRNHSYRVSYYEPAGTDAAVYIPNPDVKFINDTKNYILIQARLENNDLYFDFWGKKDGRQVFVSEPTIYNIVKPAPTKYVETDELAPGEKKCTEKAHNGADAYFDYKVIYLKEESVATTTERRFHSHYVPWREVCLVGKEVTEPSTPETINIPTTSENPNG